jgi:hypothetical protein
MKASLNLPEEFEPVTLGISVIFVAVGLLITYLMGIVTTLECTRSASTQSCHMQNTWMGLVTLSTRGVAGLDSAYVQESCDSDGCTYRVAFETSSGELPLGAAYSSGQSGKREKADLVNAFIKDPAIPSVKVADGGGFWMFFPLIFVAVGVGLVIRPVWNLIRKAINPELEV